MNSLQEGEEFEKDIQNIKQIIKNVENNCSQQRFSQQFVRSANISHKRRKIDMSRTILAQENHQMNYKAKQQ